MSTAAEKILAEATAKQREAADPEASVWVSASAGSGKTKVLVDRVLSLLLRGSEPGKILCLTFTKAAAAEMANRLSGRLAAWVTAGEAALRASLEELTGGPVDDDLLPRARALFARVLDTPGGIKIQTIHAFCQALLGRFPLEAGVAPNAKVLDEHEAADLLETARVEVLAAALDGQGRLAEAITVLIAHLQEERFTEVVQQLIHERGRLAEVIAARGGVDRLGEEVFALLGVDPAETPEDVTAAACAEGAFDRAGLRLAMEAWHNSSDKEKQKGATLAGWLAAEDAARTEAFDSHVALFLTQKGEIQKRLLNKKPAEDFPGALEALQDEAERLVLVAEKRNAITVARATRALLILGDAIIGAYQRHKEARVLLDYDDLIHFSARLLARQGGVSWVLFKLDGGLDHLLVDEAQDTSPEQWRIVEMLTSEFFTGEGAHENRDAALRTVFAVGDPKQSIYSFQRADPAEFQRLRGLFRERAKQARHKWRPVSLAVSFRSTEAVLRTVDAVFAAAEAQDGVLFGEPEIRHLARRLGEAGQVELWPPAPPAEAEELESWALPLPGRSDSPAPLRLARLVARRIWYWTQAPEGADDPQCRLAAKGRRIQPGDVMILVRRRNSFITELVRELKTLGVPVAGVDRMRLTEQLAVMDLMALGRVLLLPEDDLTLACVLKGPFIGFDEDRLFRLAYDRGRKSLWQRLGEMAPEDEAFAAARRFLEDHAGQADYVAPFELYSGLLGAGRGREKILGRLGPDAADPLDEFLSLALTYERENAPSLEGFLHWLSAGELEIKRDLEQEHGAVRLMTVHGSKGLEAPVVILPDTLQLPSAADGLLWVEDAKARETRKPPLAVWPVKRDYDLPLLGEARAARKRAQEQEYRRLLYVALTRAQDRLYLCGWLTKNTPPQGNWYQLVDNALARLAEGGEAEAVDFDFTAESPGNLGAEGWAGPGWRLARPQTAPVTAEAAAPEAAAGSTVEALPDWARQAAPPEPAPPQPLAPSRPAEAEPPSRSPLGPDSGRRFRRGLLIHRLLQSLPDLPEAERAAAGRAFLASPLHDLGAEQQAEILAEVLKVLEAPELAPLFGPGSRAEVPLAGLVETAVGPQAIAGQVDRLLVESDSVSFIDFKSQRPAPAAPEDVPSLYLKQMAAYRALLARIYPGRAIRSYLLWTDQPRLMQLSDALLRDYAP
ncbi:double-strand break repair helicase AddA [Pelagibius marinus]|uniref:double-strand break repair helicase AddA n=1 Tax=Pelagibius marinus TaxID=2762760 RepID=UPI001872C8A7|nr:double-strand break repair helicase AddA [Pelagibius marinus]